MLDLAYKHEEEIKNLMYDTWYDEKYMFYHSSTFHTPYSISNNGGDWDSRDFVSLNSKRKVIGLISYDIQRAWDLVNNFGAINFTNNKVTFATDLAQVIDDIFCKFNMRKIEFCVVVGNPIEKNYDKMVAKYGGTITGIKRKHAKLMDGNYYDHKEYEIFREDYIAAKERLKHGNK